jgi:hypothetical protein
MAADVFEKDFGRLKPAKFVKKDASATPSIIGEDLAIAGNVSAKVRFRWMVRSMGMCVAARSSSAKDLRLPGT